MCVLENTVEYIHIAVSVTGIGSTPNPKTGLLKYRNQHELHARQASIKGDRVKVCSETSDFELTYQPAEHIEEDGCC